LLLLETIYNDIDINYKKIIKEEIKDFKNIQIIIIGVFKWLNNNKKDNDLTVSYLHILY